MRRAACGGSGGQGVAAGAAPGEGGRAAVDPPRLAAGGPTYVVVKSSIFALDFTVVDVNIRD